ncbi:MAG: hypothetical protein WB562_04225 [Candidatus Sulfotelmatobacter sp.]
MLIDKLAEGIVRVKTPTGSHYVTLTFPERVYLLWMFRHFATLPLAVLHKRQQRLIDQLCSEQRFVSPPSANVMPVIGTVDNYRPVLVADKVKNRDAETRFWCPPSLGS